MASKGSGSNPGVEKKMTKKVLLIAGVLLAAGSVAAISSPYLRGGQLRLGQLLAELGGDDSSSGPERSRRRHRMAEADDEGQIGREDFTRSRRARAARHDLADDAEDMPRARERFGRRSGDRGRGRHVGDNEPGEEAREGAPAGRLTGRGEQQFARLDRNGDGFIDAKEFEIWATERAARAAQRFVKRFDTDGDGKVSREEFRLFLEDRLAKRDAGGDDEITEAELAPTKPGRGILK